MEIVLIIPVKCSLADFNKKLKDVFYIVIAPQDYDVIGLHVKAANQMILHALSIKNVVLMMDAELELVVFNKMEKLVTGILIVREIFVGRIHVVIRQ
jgi:hypothetical protein|tara:strand:+ start:241 stop:531 length:291 start_codon:yes stop_codon:yes gene_type:complete